MSAAGAPNRRPIGTLFVEKGLVTPEQLDLALERQVESRRHLGEILVEEGLISRLALASALSEQWNGMRVQPSEPASAATPAGPVPAPETPAAQAVEPAPRAAAESPPEPPPTFDA